MTFLAIFVLRPSTHVTSNDSVEQLQDKSGQKPAHVDDKRTDGDADLHTPHRRNIRAGISLSISCLTLLSLRDSIK